jgi:putative ATPase
MIRAQGMSTTMDLFEAMSGPDPNQPLAERLRPQKLNEFVGQKQILDQKKSLLQALHDKNYLPNLILWGPPGSGKTTFAKLLGNMARAEFLQVNAIDTGAKDLREIGLEAHRRRIEFQTKTILFIDEIHRLNRSQQDVLLPFSEKGDFVLIGATTENPSFELNSALLSRSQILVFERLATEDLQKLLERGAQTRDKSLSEILTPEAQELLLAVADGDARKLLNFFEALPDQSTPIDKEQLPKILATRTLPYDKKGESHYDTVSAFIKSIRGSDADAAVYYLARMIKGGEDPIFIARRLVISASEDVGNADPRALSVAVAALQAVEMVGLPEAGINLAQATTYMASAPKSNRSYAAYKKALDVVERTGSLPVPLPLRNAQTSLMKGMGYGEGYKYAHDFPRGFAEQTHLPEEIKNEKFYEPTERGFEKNIRQYLEWMRSGNFKDT